MKELQNWKEAPLYCMISSLYQLQTFYFKEINGGIAGLGEYSITSAYKDIKIIPIENILRNGVTNDIMSTGKEADTTQNEVNEQNLSK